MGRKRLYEQKLPISEYKSNIIRKMIQEESLLTMVRNVVRQNELGYNEQDLLQDCYLYFLDLPDEKLKRLVDTGEIRWFMASMVCRQYNSNVSPFYKKYRKFSINTSELPGDDDDLDEQDAKRYNLIEEDKYGTTE